MFRNRLCKTERFQSLNKDVLRNFASTVPLGREDFSSDKYVVETEPFSRRGEREAVALITGRRRTLRLLAHKLTVRQDSRFMTGQRG